MRRYMTILWFVALACGCGADTGSQRTDSGWHLEEPTDAAREEPRPDGLPDEFVDHPDEDRVHSLDWSTDVCPVPEGTRDPSLPLGHYREPSIGAVGILAVERRGDVEIQVDKYNYDIYIRFPRKADEWHRFEVRYDRDSTRDFLQTAWEGPWEENSFVSPNMSYSVLTRGCELATQEEIDAFLYYYSNIEVVFHDRATNRVLSFGPEEPLAFYSRDPDIAYSDKAGASIVFDFPVNRRAVRGRYFGPDAPSTVDQELLEELSQPWRYGLEP